MAGLSELGFTPKTLEQIKADLEQRFTDAFGDIALDPATVPGQIIGIISESAAELWQEGEDVYQSQYPDTASGISLDRAVGLNHITRLPATPTTVEAELFGAINTLIPAGSQAKASSTDDIYTLDQKVIIKAETARSVGVSVEPVADDTTYTVNAGGTAISYTSGTGESAQQVLTGLQANMPTGYTSDLSDTLRIVFPETVEVTATNLVIEGVGTMGQWSAAEVGAQILPAGALSQISTAVSGWQEVANYAPGLTGRGPETDAELRLRRKQSIRIGSRGPYDAIVGMIGQIEGVQQFRVVVNKETATNADGVPGKSVWAIVQGGSDTAIAQALFDTVAAGINTYGAESAEVVSPVNGQEFTINFGRPEAVPVYISADIVADDEFPATGQEQILNAFEAMSLDIGETLAYSRLYAPLNSVPGHYVTDLKVSVDSPASGQSNIVPATDELIVIDRANITLNVS